MKNENPTTNYTNYDFLNSNPNKDQLISSFSTVSDEAISPTEQENENAVGENPIEYQPIDDIDTVIPQTETLRVVEFEQTFAQIANENNITTENSLEVNDLTQVETPALDTSSNTFVPEEIQNIDASVNTFDPEKPPEIKIENISSQSIDELISQARDVMESKLDPLAQRISSIEELVSKFQITRAKEVGFNTVKPFENLMDNQRKVNIKPGFNSDLTTTLSKIKNPPVWRVFGN